MISTSRRSRGHTPRGIRALAALAVAVAGLVGAAVAPATATAYPSAVRTAEEATHPRNLLRNPGFEYGSLRTDRPNVWTTDAWQDPGVWFVWAVRHHRGDRSVRITLRTPNDAFWMQSVSVRPHTIYRLSGWIRTRDVAHTAEIVDAGASLGVYGRWEHTDPLYGTHGWTRVTMKIDTGEDTELTVTARLGFWAGTTTGTAWFDDMRLVRVGPAGS